MVDSLLYTFYFFAEDFDFFICFKCVPNISIIPVLAFVFRFGFFVCVFCLFVCFGCATQLVGSSLPDQGSNPGPDSESTKS